MVLKDTANDGHLALCHDEFRGPRSDYVRQVALTTTCRPSEKTITSACRDQQVWSAMGQMHDVDQALSPLIAAGLKLRSYRVMVGKAKMLSGQRTVMKPTAFTPELP
ncbi:hypothetical protein TNCV_1283691 [Trichonephila clavipes]|uniref:Uncharacterized protein n=1 Tax=Trichonephila clavipes TaxID=2585209 RepID=A0A8X6VK26_TRICX|nr:hypothetical protein TNCV_1283691 [Trichonephila clavipes]